MVMVKYRVICDGQEVCTIYQIFPKKKSPRGIRRHAMFIAEEYKKYGYKNVVVIYCGTNTFRDECHIIVAQI